MKKLNFGSGRRPKEGYVNLDWCADYNPDVVHDLNVIPYPFSDHTFDLIEADHVLEHLDKPFEAMAEFHRILVHGGTLVVRVPHFSRGFTHAEHAHGFDMTFPLYFKKHADFSGFYGVEFELKSLRFSWMAFFHLMPAMGIGSGTIVVLQALNAIISAFANLSPAFASRVWCYWVGGFEQIEFVFVAKK
jgi:SAM-dependent methyltransferase